MSLFCMAREIHKAWSSRAPAGTGIYRDEAGDLLKLFSSLESSPFWVLRMATAVWSGLNAYGYLLGDVCGCECRAFT